MTTAIDVEGRLQFTFDNTWTAFKWDADPAYLDGLGKKAEGTRATRAVDIVAILNADSVWLIEVKDPRGARISFRGTKTNLPEIVATKVRDTIAAMAWAYERIPSAHVPPALRAFFAARSKERRVVLWLEDDAETGYALALKEEIGRELKWLNPKVIVTNRALMRPEDLPGLAVASLKGAVVR